MVRLWVSPLRRGSSEGLPAALTRRRDPSVLMYVEESIRCISVKTLQYLTSYIY